MIILLLYIAYIMRPISKPQQTKLTDNTEMLEYLFRFHFTLVVSHLCALTVFTFLQVILVRLHEIIELQLIGPHVIA